MAKNFSGPNSRSGAPTSRNLRKIAEEKYDLYAAQRLKKSQSSTAVGTSLIQNNWVPRSEDEVNSIERLRKAFIEKDSNISILMDIFTTPEFIDFVQEQNKDLQPTATFVLLEKFKDEFFKHYDKFVAEVKSKKTGKSYGMDKPDFLAAKALVRSLNTQLAEYKQAIPAELTLDEVDNNNITKGCKIIYSLAAQFDKLLSCLGQQHQKLPALVR